MIRSPIKEHFLLIFLIFIKKHVYKIVNLLETESD